MVVYRVSELPPLIGRPHQPGDRLDVGKAGTARIVVVESGLRQRGAAGDRVGRIEDEITAEVLHRDEP